MSGLTSFRANAVVVVGRRDFVAALRSIGTYAALTLALGAAAWALLSPVRNVRGNGLLVDVNPLGGPLMTAILVLLMFLAVSVVVSASRDRESGTLEVLFFGPIDELSYVLGKIAGQVAVYLSALPVVLAAFLLYSWATGFLFQADILLVLVVSIVSAVQFLAFGVLLAVVTSRVRTAILALFGVTVLLIGVSVTYDLVLLVPIDDPTSAMLPLRDGLAVADAVAAWISPLAYANRSVADVLSGAWSLSAAGLLVTLGYAAMTVALAIWALRRRGVGYKEESR